MNTVYPISRDNFLHKKKDFSHLLVHLTRSDIEMDAGGVLNCILDDKELRAYNYYCIFKDEIESLNDSLKDMFRVLS